MSLKKENINPFVLAGIILASFLVRVWGIGFGLPYIYNPDEGKLIYTTFFAASHWLRPDIFIHSTLVSYLLIPVYGFYFILGKLAGIFSSPFSFYVAYLANPTTLVIIGRLLLVLVSLGCGWVIFIIGKRFYRSRAGVLGMFFLSFCFLFVKESHYIKDEILAAFFLTSFFYFLLLVFTRGHLKDYFWAGIFLGVSISAKYIYLPVVLVLILADRWGKKKTHWLFLSLLLMVLIFFLTNPYMIIDFPHFFSQTKSLFLNERSIGIAMRGNQPAWLNFLKAYLPLGLGWPLFVISIISVILGLTGILGKKFFLLALAITLLFVGLIAGGGNFERWLVSLLPFLCLAAGFSLDKWFKGKKIALLLVAFLVILPGLIRIIKFDLILTWPDTRTMAKVWIEENLPSREKIAIEGTQSGEVPSYLGPPLVLAESQLEAKLREAIKAGQLGLSLKAQIEATRGKVGYNLIGAFRLDRPFDDKQSRWLEIKDVNFYVDNQLTYLISSSWVNREGREVTREFQTSLEKNYQLIQEFRPTIMMANEPHAWRMDYSALDQVPLFHQGIFGPVIKIYEIKAVEVSKPDLIKPIYK